MIYCRKLYRAVVVHVTVAFCLSGAAAAQDLPVSPDQPPLPQTSPAGPEFSFSFGVDVVSNYISKGFTQTDDKPAIQPYAEFAYGPVYLFLWASNADFGEEDIEFDVELGVTPSFGKLDLSLGFVQYFYRDDDEDYGEAFIRGDYAVTEQFSVGLDLYREVYAEYDTAYLNAEYSGLPWGLSVSAGIGSDFGTRDLGRNADYGDLGISKNLGDNFAVDLRGQFSRIEDNRLVATLSFFY